MVIGIKFRYESNYLRDLILLNLTEMRSILYNYKVLRNDEQTSLIVDGVSQSRTTKGKEFQFGKFATNSEIYVGGMPNW